MIDIDKYHIDKLFIPNTFATTKLIKEIHKYKYVIGIADQSKNATRSRFDPKYINRYGKRNILENEIDEYSSNLDIDIPEEFYKYKGITNGPCNRSAYLAMNEITNNHLDTKFGFFHLCKNTVEQNIYSIINIYG